MVTTVRNRESGRKLGVAGPENQVILTMSMHTSPWRNVVGSAMQHDESIVGVARRAAP